MLSPELKLQLIQASRNLMYEQQNGNHDSDIIIKIHNAYEAIQLLIDPTYTPIF